MRASKLEGAMSITVKNQWKVMGDLRECELEDTLNALEEGSFKINEIFGTYRSCTNDMRFTIVARQQKQRKLGGVE